MAKHDIIKILAKPISYDKTRKRKKTEVKYIVIHYTGNKGDTAVNNGQYFATGNMRSAGAHYFIDKDGVIVRSIPINRTAWAVGGPVVTQTDGAASLHGVCTNFNSVSIELCDYTSGYPSDAQVEACKWLVKKLRKKCPNIGDIVRHWDVTGKDCPHPMTGKGNKNWLRFKKELDAA